MSVIAFCCLALPLRDSTLVFLKCLGKAVFRYCDLELIPQSWYPANYILPFHSFTVNPRYNDSICSERYSPLK